MRLSSSRITAAALTTVASLALVGGCTAGSPAPSPTQPTASPTPTPSPSPSPEPQTAELTLPAGPATVLEAADAAGRATAASAALYTSSPVVVLAPLDDAAAQVRAAAVAVALGVPLLLSGPDASPTAELDRLEAGTVLTVGAVTLDTDDLNSDDLDTADVALIPVPEDDTALSELLGVDLTQVPWPTPGGEVTTVAALDRSAPSMPAAMLAVPAEGGTTDGTGAPPEPTPPPSEPAAAGSEPSASASASASGSKPSPSASPSPLAAGPTLPETTLADPVPGGLLLTTGDPLDLAAVATARAAGVPVVVVPGGDPRVSSATVQPIASVKPTSVIGLGAAFGDATRLGWTSATAASGQELPGGGQLVLPGRRYVAMYGTPTYAALGVLGEQDVPSSIARVQGLAAAYQALTTDQVVPAFEMIVTVASASAGADGNYSNELPIETFVPWIEAAAAAGVYVVLDLQPGRTDFVTQARLYEPLLAYPNVGLALDPEWRLLPDQVHLRQIGSVTIEEVNAVGAYLAELTRTRALPQKLFVLHQFKHTMIQGREALDMSHSELAMMIHVDGQGGQGAKAGTWASLHSGAPAGIAWGWKNFIDEDIPMLTPAETYAVQPAPQLVTYQ